MRILVADDEKVVRELISRHLDAAGYDVVGVPDVSSAEDVLNDTGADLVITDVRMPVRSGIELLRLSKSRNPEAEVIVMTGFADVDSAAAAVDENAFAFLRKPFCVEELVSVVERAAERMTLRKQSKQHAEELEALVGKLEASEHRYRSLVEGINGAVVLMGSDLVIRSASERCAEILGRSPADLVGTSVDDLRRDGDAAEFRRRVAALFEESTGFLRWDSRVRRPDGSTLDTAEVAMPSSEDVRPGAPPGVCWIITDRSAASRLKQEAETAREYLEAVRRAASGTRKIVGESKAIRDVLRTIKRVAPTDASVLICGESGTGKELVAESIHRNSRRAERPFVVVNCAALPETLLESELFGYRKGAFTGATQDKRGLADIADGGTLFVDEITEMSPAVQGKLLRVVETGQFRQLGSTEHRTTEIRIVAATNRDLAQEVRAGRFREDLLYRLDVIRIELPPLRDRREDIPLIAEHLLRHTRVTIRRTKHLARPALDALIAYDWPGNVRELSNVIERAVILSGDREEIRAEDLFIAEDRTATPARTLRQVQDAEVAKALAMARGNKTQAAKTLGVTRQTLINWLKRADQSGPPS